MWMGFTLWLCLTIRSKGSNGESRWFICLYGLYGIEIVDWMGYIMGDQ